MALIPTPNISVKQKCLWPVVLHMKAEVGLELLVSEETNPEKIAISCPQDKLKSVSCSSRLYSDNSHTAMLGTLGCISPDS